MGGENNLKKGERKQKHGLIEQIFSHIGKRGNGWGSNLTRRKKKGKGVNRVKGSKNHQS